MTSFDCVSRLRRILHTKKIGHSGTLDPNVDGVLPTCVGQATKVVEFLMASGKQYVGELLVGEATTTQNLDGEVVAQKPVMAPIAEDTIRKAMQELTGDIIQHSYINLIQAIKKYVAFDQDNKVLVHYIYRV